MFHVWTDNGTEKMKVASADTLTAAMHYALQYRDEGRVTVKDGNTIAAILSAKRTVVDRAYGPTTHDKDTGE